jgi:hypothetical protein
MNRRARWSIVAGFPGEGRSVAPCRMTTASAAGTSAGSAIPWNVIAPFTMV